MCPVANGPHRQLQRIPAVPTTTPETDLKRILAGAQLPALPQSAIRLLELAQDPNNGPAEFALPIESDPGLTGQVLRFVNSSYFGFSREISSVKLAITLVGIRTIKNFALWSAVFSLMPNPQCGPFDLKKLWQDSLRRGLFARAFGKLLGLKDAEESFAAALLQDMAVPLLAKELSKDYVVLLGQRDGGRARLSTMERERFGWTHAQAAAEIARSWNLPAEFADLVEQHCCIEELLTNSDPRPEVVAVALSALLPAASDETWVECPLFEQAYQHFRRPDSPSIPDFLARIDQEFVEFAPVLKLSAPAKSLVESYNEVAVPAG
jgi:HD-like signal output (HDOD) protein